MRVLGIDPGSVATGYGVVDRVESKLVHVAHGILRTRKGGELAPRLGELFSNLQEVIQLHEPDVLAVERVFVAASPKSALVLGQARGVALAAGALASVPVREYSPSEIKRAVVGTGAAGKQQVQWMVARLLGLDRRPATDAADALAAAICHGNAARPYASPEELEALQPRRRRSRRSRGYVLRRAR